MRAAAIVAATSLLACALGDLDARQAKTSEQDEKIPALIKQLQQPSAKDKLAALQALADFGPQAREAVPPLVELLQGNDDDLRLNAAITLGKIGKPAVPRVTKLLASKDAELRYYAVWTLGFIGPEAKDAAGDVLRALADPDDNVRRKAAYTLGRIGQGAALVPLLEALGDKNADVRQAATDALAGFGPAAVRPLIQALDDDAAARRQHAARALAKIGADAKDAVPHLRPMLFGNERTLALEAADTLAKIGKVSLPTLTDAVKHERPEVRQIAVSALGKMGADGALVLVDALADKNVDVRRQAAQVLLPMRISDTIVVLALAHAAKDDDQTVRQTALRALQMLGAGAKLATPTLVAALKEAGDVQTRSGILGVLQNVPAEPDLIVPVVAALLRDESPTVRQGALNTLAVQGRPALPHVLAALQDSSAVVRYAAVRALQRIPGELKDALPALVPLLKETNLLHRRTVVSALGRVGEPAVPHLVIALKDPQAQVRWAAADALGTVGPDAKKAVPALLELPLTDPALAVRRSAVAALTRVAPDRTPELFAAVKKHANAKIRQDAYAALASYRVPAKLSLPPLMDALQDASAPIRQGAVQAIGALPPEDARPAIPLLTKLVDDPNAAVSSAARAVLERLKAK